MILHYNDTTLNIDVDDSSYRFREIKGNHNLTLYFSLDTHIEIPVGAWCEFGDEQYTLEAPHNLVKHNTENFEYTLVMESVQSRLLRYKYKSMPEGRLKFDQTATPRHHLDVLVWNLNQRESGWVAGDCVDAVSKHIAFNHTTCKDALGQIADAFETEWEIRGKTISLCKVEYYKNNPLPLSYGRGNGFKPNIGRTTINNSKPIEVLYVQGGERNIDLSKYAKDVSENGSSVLLLPRDTTIRFDGEYFEGDDDFNIDNARVYLTDSIGASIQRADKELLSHLEGSLDLSSVYPRRVGSISEVMVTDKGFCDVVDDTIPSTLDYNDYQLDEEKPTIIFQTGILAGKEFDVIYIHEALNGKPARRFEIVEQNINGQPMPKDTFMPVSNEEIRDTYSIFNCMLPEQYVKDAEMELFKEAVKYLYENEEQKFTFTGELNGIWAKNDWLNISGRIRLGAYILFSDTQFQKEGVGIRIMGVKDYINNPHSPILTLSNSTVGSSFMSNIGKIESNEVVVESNKKQIERFAKRGFRQVKETEQMLSNSLIEIDGKMSLNTMQLIVGADSLQFEFVHSKEMPVSVPHDIIYDKHTNILTVSGGVLRHLTLGIDYMSSSYDDSAYKYWSLFEFNVSDSALKDDKAYYLYVKASKTTEEASFYISETAKEMNSDDGYYYFTYGILNSKADDVRDFVELYGFTEITPGGIRTKKIVSNDGNTYFDLERGEIGGRIAFSSGSTGLDNIPEFADVVGDTKNKLIYRWDNDVPSKPSGLEPWNWTNEPTPVVALANEMGFALTDENDNIITFETKEQYQLWMSQAIFNGRGEKLTDWSEPIKMGEDLEAKENMEQAVADTKEKVAQGMGYVDYNEMVAKAQEGVTIIKGGHINTDLIEADKLVINKLSTFGGQVKINNDEAIIGDIDVDADGSISIGTGVHLTKGAIPALSTMVTGGSEGETSIWNMGRYFETTQERVSKVLYVPSNGSTLTINTYIEAAAYNIGGTSSIKNDINDVFMAQMTMSLYKNNSYYRSLGTVTAHTRNDTQSNDSYKIEWAGQVDTGNYHIGVDVTIRRPISNGYPDGIYGESYAWISGGGKMHHKFVNQIMKTEIGNNGIATALDTDNYEYTSVQDGKLKKTFKGELDMPGVLASCSVNAAGNISRGYGAKVYIKKAGKLGEGKYEVYHNIGHTDYTITANVSHNYGNSWAICVVAEKQKYHAVIHVVHINNGFANLGFDITFIGHNNV